ncbi:hypothetical protein SLEP1_g2734 [Rubroshorea leprosula]|uniref:Uncharacterized protein n=1 Tax=Rubroshorea leprosula TaxID=152421 RepID=A0AAV5HIJ2_9ROSI|nr:hypothetical protein SLEP1_g2734 [Rubroshorea leprosula]
MERGTMHFDFPLNQFQYPSAYPHPSNLNLPVSANHSAPFESYSSSPPPPPPPPTSCSCCRTQIRRTADRLTLGLGPVPSKIEVENAVSSLEKFMGGVSSPGPELKWLCNVGGRIFHVFRLMQTQQSFKRLVVSLSSDKAVWDAIKNNEMVRKLCESPIPAEKGEKLDYPEIEVDPDLIAKILNWIFDIAKAKVVELVLKLQALVSEVFRDQDSKNWTDNSREQLEDIVRSSLVLSMVILLIVVITRVQGA